MLAFEYTPNPIRVLAGPTTRTQLPAEIHRLARARVLLLHGSHTPQDTKDLLGPLLTATFDGARMHTPIEVTEQALEIVRNHHIDCIVSIGGGSTTGLSKAIALRTNLPQIIIPTTYAGSEMTKVLGETANGVKTTRSSTAILPKTVIYDVELTLGLPIPISITSGVNALAHAVEALYSPDANPITDRLALDAITKMTTALPKIAQNPQDLQARIEALQAAWLAGTCLGTVGMGLHHKLCHTLGGSFGLPHSETHTVLLPHVMAYNAQAAPEAMRKIAEALGATDAPTAMFDLITSLPAPTSLRELGRGLTEADLPKAAELATTDTYPNPRKLTTDSLTELLRNAWNGTRPPATQTDTHKLTDQVVASFAATPNPRVRDLLTDLVRTLHEYVTRHDLTDSEWQYAIDFLTRTGQLCSDTRQEFILLSDTLGVSSVVDLLTNSRTPDTTPSAVLGPFYVAGPPHREHGADIAEGLPGEPLWTDVEILDLKGNPVPAATVDVWQSNKDGFYDVQLPDQDGPVLRARFSTDTQGRLRFWSILPSAYPIPADGPVGEMLTSTGRHPYRAPHLHFMIAKPGFRTLVTQLFVRGGQYLDSDTVFGVKDGLIVDFTEQHGPTPDGRELDGGWRRLDFTFRIAAA